MALLDKLFLFVHTALIVFVLVGWIWPGSRRVHFWLLLVIAGCWFGFGLRYGIGFCPCTDWHWQIRRQLGDQHLPVSYIKFLLDAWLEVSLNPQLVDTVTLLVFVLVFSISSVLNYCAWRKERSRGFLSPGGKSQERIE